MGIDIRPKNRNGRTYHSTYGAYFALRSMIAHSYSSDLGNMFDSINIATSEDVQHWNDICDNDLDLLLLHSDCEGKLAPDECRRILKAIDKIEFRVDTECPEELYKNLYNDLVATLEYASQHNVNLYFS